ncbi:MAG: hypothetical protein RI562_08535 [Salibacter sp.]|nr:hypothetical protein [Salibacter sp.]MDR9399096.1 hypothetical protein [Salibacter sp.]
MHKLFISQKEFDETLSIIHRLITNFSL